MTPQEFKDAANVSRETLDRLTAYAELLVKWNPAINLVSKASLDSLWSRHMLDSVHVFRSISSPAGLWADLGSGGGFPGLVVAILAIESAPDLQVVLVESDTRKAAFLSTVARATGAKVRVIADRIEKVAPLGCDIISARALAPLVDLLGYADLHLKPGGTAIFPKGATAAAEIDAARRLWRFDLVTLRSQTDPDASLLRITELTRA